MATVLELQNLSKSFHDAGRTIPVLAGASLVAHAGRTVAVLGPSGSGKSTLLHLAGLLDVPDGGKIWLDGHAMEGLKDRARTRLRREKLGFIYQHHHLLPELNALENVALPLRLQGVPVAKANTRASELLARLGLADRLMHRPAALSGGQQQRVAIARALVHQPRLVLADEPTGNLDRAAADDTMNLFLELVKDQQSALVMVTHNEALAERLDARYHLVDGKLVN
jgi:lipoprotein-releasing system ATP-binding protein